MILLHAINFCPSRSRGPDRIFLPNSDSPGLYNRGLAVVDVPQGSSSLARTAVSAANRRGWNL